MNAPSRKARTVTSAVITPVAILAAAALIRQSWWRFDTTGLTQTQPPATIQSSSLTFTLSAQGDNTITYYATDRFGVTEAEHVEHVKLDNIAPVLAVTSRTGDMSHAQWSAACTLPGVGAGICGTVTDDRGSGATSVEYVLYRASDGRCFDGQNWSTLACHKRTGATLEQSTWFAAVPDATLPQLRTWYTVTVYAKDAAGNTTNTTRNFSIG